MKIIEKYNLNKNKYPKYIILIKVGIFYETYNEDAYILNNLFNYKIKEINNNKRLGFPTNSYDKVITKLKEFKINYIIIEDDITKKTFKQNNYSNYIPNNLTIEEKINKITNKLNILKNNPNINTILKNIEKILLKF